MRTHHIAVCMLLALCPLGAGEAASAPDGTATALWQLLNRLRTDPRTGCFAVSSLMHAGVVDYGSYSARMGDFDWGKAITKIAPGRPLVLHPQLCAAARKLLDGGAQPPDQRPVDASAAAATAGYGNGEVAGFLAVAAPSLEAGFARAAAHIHGIMKAKTREFAQFDATRMTDPAWREAGVACTATTGGVSVAIVLGRGGGERLLGGVVYADANRDGSYDPGEGVAGLIVEAAGVRGTTSAGGAWWLRLPADGPATLTCTVPDGTITRSLQADQIICDIRLPVAADGTAADRLLADLAREMAGTDAERQRRARVAVLLGTRRSVLDDARQARVDAAVAPVRDGYEETLRQALGSLDMKPADYRKRLAELTRSWNGALPAAWSKRLESVCAAGQQVVAAQAATPEQQAKLVPAALAQVRRLLAEAEDTVVRNQLSTWDDALTALSPPAPAPRTAAKAAR